MRHWVESLILNNALGCWFTTTFLIVLSLHPLLVVITSFTVKVPLVLNVCVGVFKLENEPSPKLHKDVNVPEDTVELLLKRKLFVSKHCAFRFALNDAVGFGFTVTVVDKLSLHPLPDTTISFTVYTPLAE